MHGLIYSSVKPLKLALSQIYYCTCFIFPVIGELVSVDNFIKFHHQGAVSIPLLLTTLSATPVKQMCTVSWCFLWISSKV